MKKRYSEEQIHKVLKESESGVSSVESMESAEIHFTAGVRNTEEWN
ncbi:hypothetical protein LEP1GSC021_0684 [Leptospira noguchii str. 1993005606]|uniref:Uncharacterized protein n=1 Tax=Leptospira noguchii str. 2001034031 TaxID=1193053 RepID=M6YW61_9LEPT|nr:hypothetical protein LEP1GSC024_4353 [Leptospira noguchii str. 2001034031]EPE85785.1 hypothetical protein LEP1GSC021_0684 [Leptospira noguchii str. 1993005606]